MLRRPAQNLGSPATRSSALCMLKLTSYIQRVGQFLIASALFILNPSHPCLVVVSSLLGSRSPT